MVGGDSRGAATSSEHTQDSLAVGPWFGHMGPLEAPGVGGVQHTAPRYNTLAAVWRRAKDYAYVGLSASLPRPRSPTRPGSPCGNAEQTSWSAKA